MTDDTRDARPRPPGREAHEGVEVNDEMGYMEDAQREAGHVHEHDEKGAPVREVE